MDIEQLKQDAGYVPGRSSRAFASKWADKLDEETVELVQAFHDYRVAEGFGAKGAASYKSLVLRYLATKTWSQGKSGDSMKSAVMCFIDFCDLLTETAELAELEADDEELDEEA